MANLTLPIKWKELSQEETLKIKTAYPVSFNNDMVCFDNGVMMPRTFIPAAERLYNFSLRDDDIWIVTFPKTGTTWTQEMVWMLVNDVDKEKGAKPQMQRSPFLEIGAMMGVKEGHPMLAAMPAPMAEVMKDPFAYADQMTGRRVLKSHMPMEFLPPNLTKRCKVVYVARNPRDTCVSYMKHMQDMPGHGYVGEFPEFAENFKNGLQMYGDYWHHILSGWNVRNEPNVIFLWFEDMKKDQKKIIEDLCIFLDHPLTPELVDRLVDHLKFDNMKQNQFVNPSVALDMKKGNFMRKGQVGDWKNFFNQEKTEEWAKWIQEKTNGTGLAEKLPPF